MTYTRVDIKYTPESFVTAVTGKAKKAGHVVERSARSGLTIDFGNKKLHETHLRNLFPEILYPGADIAALIERVAPGRPCTHKPMREIIQKIT